jgi:hypothetical protein
VNHPGISFLLYQAGCIVNFLGLKKSYLPSDLLRESMQLNFYSIATNPFLHSRLGLRYEFCDIYRGHVLDINLNPGAVKFFTRMELVDYFLSVMPKIFPPNDDLLISQYKKIIS